jgi:hypothetical protein
VDKDTPLLCPFFPDIISRFSSAELKEALMLAVRYDQPLVVDAFAFSRIGNRDFVNAVSFALYSTDKKIIRYLLSNDAFLDKLSDPAFLDDMIRRDFESPNLITSMLEQSKPIGHMSKEFLRRAYNQILFVAKSIAYLNYSALQLTVNSALDNDSLFKNVALKIGNLVMDMAGKFPF